MNRTLSMAGSATVTVTVFLFAVFIIAGNSFMQYFVCMLLTIGFIMMTAGFQQQADAGRKAAANIGMALAAVYAVLVLLVYFAQDTTVNNAELSEQAADLIDFSRGGLIFSYDLLGYGMMALSTFFTGLSVKAVTKSDKWLKGLMLVHGAFFPGCFIMPMTGMFMDTEGKGSGGYAALVIWCAYFLPIGILALIHFGKGDREKENKNG